jgi:hypothetical protein
LRAADKWVGGRPNAKTDVTIAELIAIPSSQQEMTEGLRGHAEKKKLHSRPAVEKMTGRE